MVARSCWSRLRSGILISFGAAIAICLPEATAQAFPAKEIRLIIPFPPGGGVDNTARIVATKLSTMGYTVVAENRAGAMGDIGYVAVAKANPDGYTLLMGSAGNLALRHQVRSDAPYKPEDYLPISLVSTVPHVIVMSGSLPSKNLKEFTSYFKSSGQSIAWGASGILGMHHLAGVMFGAVTAIDILHVPYQGTGPLFPDLVAGRTHATSIEINTGLPYIQSGKLRALGIAAAARSSMLPDVPTMAELGFADFEVTSWFGLLAPLKTPPDIVNQLSQLVQKAVAAPDVQELLAKQGATPAGGTPEQFAAFIRSENARMAKALKLSGFQKK